jgi:hypothetical protein
MCVCFGISRRSFLSERLYVHSLLECVGVIFLMGILVYMSIKDFRILSLQREEEVDIL